MNLTPDRLAELAVTALERTAFMMSEPVPCDTEALAATTYSAAIRYGGPGGGQVTLHAADGFLRELAASLLGEASDSVNLGSYGEDAIKELTNIVGGSVILELGGDACTYTLGLPHLILPLPTGSTPPPSRTCCLNCEGHLLFITWEPDSQATAVAA